MKLRQARNSGRYRLWLALAAGAPLIGLVGVSVPLLSEANSNLLVAQTQPAEEGAAAKREKAKQAKPEVAAAIKPKPEAAKPDSATKSDPARSDPAKPDAAKQDVAKSDPAKPDSAKTEPPKPDPGKADAAKPDPTSPPQNSLAGAASAGATATPPGISAKLVQNDVGTCASAIDTEAGPSMLGVTQSNTISLWSNIEPRDRHAASVFIGQRYGTNQAVPYGVTGLVASPTPSGNCDVTVVQVVSSPLPCAKVRETLVRQDGKLVGEIVGMPVVQSSESQTLLMPTATNSCVLIGFRTKFGN